MRKIDCLPDPEALKTQMDKTLEDTFPCSDPPSWSTPAPTCEKTPKRARKWWFF